MGGTVFSKDHAEFSAISQPKGREGAENDLQDPTKKQNWRRSEETRAVGGRKKDAQSPNFPPNSSSLQSNFPLVRDNHAD